MNTNTDLIRSHVDTIIMRTLESEDRYGYEILDIIGSLSNYKYVIKQPTLYSCLKRLEKQGFISSYEGSETNGRQRRYYKLEEKGLDTLAQDKIEWEFSRSIIDKLLSDKKVNLEVIEPPFDASNLRPLTKRIKAYDVLENGSINYDVNQEILLDELEEDDSVSLALFSECKKQLRDANEKIRDLESIIHDNKANSIDAEYIETLENQLKISSQKIDELELFLAYKNDHNDELSSELDNFATQKVNFNDTNNGDLKNNDYVQSLILELEEANATIQNFKTHNITLESNVGNDSKLANDYLHKNIEDLQNTNSKLNSILKDKNKELDELTIIINDLNRKLEIDDKFNEKTVTSNILFNNMDINNKKEVVEHKATLLTNNKFNSDDPNVIKQEINQNKINAKKLLSIGEFSQPITPYLDDENNRIDYKEAVVAETTMNHFDNIAQNEADIKIKKNYKYNEDVDGEYLIEKTQNTVKNSKNCTIQNNPIVNLKNEMIKSGYKVKTFAKDSTSDYYCKNYIYANKMTSFVALCLFMVNIIESLIFGIAKSFFTLNTIGLIIIITIVSIPPIFIMLNSFINSSKITKKTDNYIKSLAKKMLYFTVLTAITLLIFNVIPQLNEYFGKGLMFVPIILFLNIPLSEGFKCIAEKSNKFNVNYQ